MNTVHTSLYQTKCPSRRMRVPIAFQFLIIPIALSLSACSTQSQYMQPNASQPSAELTITPNQHSPSGYDVFDAYDNDTCTKTTGGSALATFNEPPQPKAQTTAQTIRIWPNKRVYLRSVTVEKGAVNRTDICTNVVSFVPETSKRYKIKQILTRDRSQVITDCKMVVTNLDTGQAVASFQKHDISKTCKYHR